jgi:hypothetical protein
MSGHAYLAGLLAAQALLDAELVPLRNARDHIERWLRGDIGSAPRIYYGGSFAKKTMLKLGYDLDIVVYFPSTENSTVEQLFNRIHNRLLVGKFTVNPRTVALRLPYEGGFHIDVVPGRAQDANFRYATLYKRPGPLQIASTLQTSLKVHIESVKDAGLSEVVRLAKLWRTRWGLEFPSFALELAVARAMYNMRRDDLAVAFLHVLRFFATDLANARLVDPANSGNVIELSTSARNAIAARAQWCLQQKDWSSIVW